MQSAPDRPDSILERARALAGSLSEWRRDFHAHPELGFQERRTAARIAEVLRELGYQVRTGVGRTGVVAERGGDGPVIAIRADMDALPVEEANDVPYRSQEPGRMHACGHDSHMACALGAAALLAKTSLPGKVRFLFQPSEEDDDEQGLSGAPRMIADGCLEGVSAILALHAEPEYLPGQVVVNPGYISAGVDTFYAAVIGKGGHGAYPDETVDPIHLTGQVIQNIHSIVSRRIDPMQPAVISIGSIHGGQADNVIPDRVDLSGTIRYLSDPVQAILHTELEKALQVTRPLGGDYTLKIEKGYPPSANHPDMVAFLNRVASDLLGPQAVQPPINHLGAEDFGYFGRLLPSVMFYLGCGLPEERHLHSATFDLDEACLPVGAALFAEAAVRFLEGGGTGRT